MANVVQMGVDAFRDSLQRLSVAARQERARLEADKLRLQAAYSATRNDSDRARASKHQAILRPLISMNSKLRVRYSDMVRSFNAAVSGAASVLKSAGFSFQPLSGMGVGPALAVPVVAVAALGTAWAIYAIVHEQNATQNNMISAALATINNPMATDAERQQALDVVTDLSKRKPPGSDIFNLEGMLPLAMLAAAIVIVPPLLERRRAVT